MTRIRPALIAGITALTLTAGSLVAAPAAVAAEPAQILKADFATDTGTFRGGASGTLYGLGDNGSPTDAILRGASIENTSQKPPFGTQHPSGDALAVEDQFFANGGNELGIYVQDYYPDWFYNGGKRPGDDRTYDLSNPGSDTYGSYTAGADGVWDFLQVSEIVVNETLRNTKHPDKYTFIPFNEPDGGNWYWSEDDANAPIFKQFLQDWDAQYALIQRIFDQYKSGERVNVHGIKPTGNDARIAGPGDSAWRQNRTDAFLASAKAHGTLPQVFVWHELGAPSLERYRSHYASYRALEKKHGVAPLPINITEYGELRDMGVPGQLMQWLAMFEETKVQAETAYWNQSGNLSDNMARANAGNGGWWAFKWYADLRGSNTVKLTPPHVDWKDSLAGIAAIDKPNRKATVLYGGANNNADPNTAANAKTGTNIPVTLQASGLDAAVFGNKVDVVVKENAYTGPDGVAAEPRTVQVLKAATVQNGAIEVTTNSVDRYASYQVVITPASDAPAQVDDATNGGALWTVEAEKTVLSGGAVAFGKTPEPPSWGEYMFSGNGDVGAFKNGARATWTVDVPADGKYRLQAITANVGFPGTNGVTVNGQNAGTLNIPAELAVNDTMDRWKYRGSAEVVLELKKGQNQIAINASDMDNTLDKLLLYQVTAPDGAVDRNTYLAHDFRLAGGARLSYDGNGTNGSAKLNGGTAELYAHAWTAGYHDVTVTYAAVKGSKVSLSSNGLRIIDFVAATDGTQTSTVRVALSEGINMFTLSGDSVYVQSLSTTRTTADDTAATVVEAENMTLRGGARKVQDVSSDASGKSWVTGLGVNAFELTEIPQNRTGGYGDQTRVKVLNADNDPWVNSGNNGELEIPAGTVKPGTYNAVVRFSNDAYFDNGHDGAPQNADLGLQIKSGSTVLGRGMFRYTYTDKGFLNRSIELTVPESGPLVVSNFETGTTYGVAPNVDSITFYPVIAPVRSLVKIQFTAEARCTAGKVQLALKATNTGATAASLSMSSAYGSKNATLAAGATTSAVFATRAASVAAGEATVNVTQGSMTGTVTAAYAAKSCG